MSQPAGLLLPFLLLGLGPSITYSADNNAQATAGSSRSQPNCATRGWKEVTLEIGGIPRRLFWNGPGKWTKGSIIVLHGGGGEAEHFCQGGKWVQPQIEFAEMAIEKGFAVFALDATIDIVTDEAGRTCGKRFDFSVLDRPNIDLPYIENVITKIIPENRPAGSNDSMFMTGLSTGGYMTIRAATHFDKLITAFAPVSAGDPYGTDTNCDTSLSERTSAKGVLIDRETSKQIIEQDSCKSPTYDNESPWESSTDGAKPAVRQFHHRLDGIVDVSCMKKVTEMLERNAYATERAFLIRQWGGKKSVVNHLWLNRYNKPLLKFFAEQS